MSSQYVSPDDGLFHHTSPRPQYHQQQHIAPDAFSLSFSDPNARAPNPTSNVNNIEASFREINLDEVNYSSHSAVATPFNLDITANNSKKIEAASRSEPNIGINTKRQSLARTTSQNNPFLNELHENIYANDRSHSVSATTSPFSNVPPEDNPRNYFSRAQSVPSQLTLNGINQYNSSYQQPNTHQEPPQQQQTKSPRRLQSTSLSRSASGNVSVNKPAPTPSPPMEQTRMIANCANCASPIMYFPDGTRFVKVACYNCPYVNSFAPPTPVHSLPNPIMSPSLASSPSSSSSSSSSSSPSTSPTSPSSFPARPLSHSKSNPSNKLRKSSHNVHTPLSQLEDQDDENNDDVANDYKEVKNFLNSDVNLKPFKGAFKTLRSKAAETKKKVESSHFIGQTKEKASVAAKATKAAAQKATDGTKAAAQRAKDSWAQKQQKENEGQSTSPVTSPRVDSPSVPPAAPISPEHIVFGVPLDEAIQKSAHLDPTLPDVVTKCVQYLYSKGLKEEGLFRLSGSLATVRKLKDGFDRGEDVDLSGIADEHVVSGLLKLYLRELPQSLFSGSYVEELKSLEKEVDVNKEHSLQVVKNVIAEIPESNRNLLGVLLRILKRVSDLSSVNKMTVNNLAIVFSPTLQIPSEVVAFTIRFSEEILPPSSSIV